MTIATGLAERIAAFSYDLLPPEAVHWAKVGILDTVGVTLAGANEPTATILDAIAPGEGPCLIFGRERTAGALDAALINGTAAHAHDFDDCNNTIGGHPSAPILPALFAIADMQEVSGRDFLTAYVAGFEVETRIARSVHFHHYEKGWHPTATLGTFGSTAASCKLLGLDEDKTAIALGLATSLASGIKANFGTMTKPLHVGNCARAGLMAAMLARDGFTASKDAFEHGQGFWMVFNGEGNFHPEKVFENWASPLDIVFPAIAIKQYPCCGSTHPAIDGILALVREHGLTPDMVERVESYTHPRRLKHTNRPDPQGELDAKFSVQYCLARGLMHGKIQIEHFENEAYNDPTAREIMSRIQAAPHPEMKMENTDHFGAEVRAFTRDGRTLVQKVDRPLGRGAEKPLPLDLLDAKFIDCARRVLNDDAVQALLHQIWRIDEMESMGDLRATLRSGMETRV